jgi:hypothetical protein
VRHISTGTSAVTGYKRTSESNLYIHHQVSPCQVGLRATDWSPVPSKHSINVRTGCSGGITAGNGLLALAKVEPCGLVEMVAESLSAEEAVASWA